MGALLSQVIPLALGAAISPVLFLLTLTTLTGERGLVRGVAVTLGAAVPLVLLAVFAFAVAGKLHLSATTKAVVDLAFGVLLFLVAVRALVTPPSEPKADAKPKKPAGPGRSFALGFGAMATNVTTIALYIPAMKLIATSHVSDADRVLAHVIVLLIVLAPAAVPVALVAVAPGSSRRGLDALARFMTDHRREIPVVLGFGFGLLLIVKGLAAL